jgi:hypothetical protein
MRNSRRLHVIDKLLDSVIMNSSYFAENIFSAKWGPTKVNSSFTWEMHLFTSLARHQVSLRIIIWFSYCSRLIRWTWVQAIFTCFRQHNTKLKRHSGVGRWGFVLSITWIFEWHSDGWLAEVFPLKWSNWLMPVRWIEVKYHNAWNRVWPLLAARIRQRWCKDLSTFELLRSPLLKSSRQTLTKADISIGTEPMRVTFFGVSETVTIKSNTSQD